MYGFSRFMREMKALQRSARGRSWTLADNLKQAMTLCKWATFFQFDPQLMAPFRSSKLMWPHPTELTSTSLTRAHWSTKAATSQVSRVIVWLHFPVADLITWKWFARFVTWNHAITVQTYRKRSNNKRLKFGQGPFQFTEEVPQWWTDENFPLHKNAWHRLLPWTWSLKLSRLLSSISFLALNASLSILHLYFCNMAVLS